MRIVIYILITFSICCCSVYKKDSKSFNPTEREVNNMGNISLLNRIRTHPGVYVEGTEQNARVYTRGVNSINNQKEFLFVLNGVKVGNYSQISKILSPSDIKNITILKNASDIASYGFNGSGGVILIKTH